MEGDLLVAFGVTPRQRRMIHEFTLGLSAADADADAIPSLNHICWGLTHEHTHLYGHEHANMIHLCASHVNTCHHHFRQVQAQRQQNIAEAWSICLKKWTHSKARYKESKA